MIAFVLSGGGNRGALQVGALQVLLEAGIRPEMLVGTSAGAINAAFLAANPTPAGARQLGEIWRQVTKEDVYPGGPLRVAWHLTTHRDSLYPNGNFQTFLEAHVPPGGRFFHQLTIPLYIVAADLHSGHLHLFGEDPQEPIVEAILASTALPPLFPPQPYQDDLLVDGCMAANLPVGVAVEKGATEIYALAICRKKPPDKGHWNVREISEWSIATLIRQQWDRELTLCAVHPEVTLHHLPLHTEWQLVFDDFGQAAELIAEGREMAEACLVTWNLSAVTPDDQPLRGWQRAFRWLDKGFERLRSAPVSLARRSGNTITTT